MCACFFFRSHCKCLPFNHIFIHIQQVSIFRRHGPFAFGPSQTRFRHFFGPASSAALAKKQLQKHSAKMKATKPAELMTLVNWTHRSPSGGEKLYQAVILGVWQLRKMKIFGLRRLVVVLGDFCAFDLSDDMKRKTPLRISETRMPSFLSNQGIFNVNFNYSIFQLFLVRHRLSLSPGSHAASNVSFIKELSRPVEQTVWWVERIGRIGRAGRVGKTCSYT